MGKWLLVLIVLIVGSMKQLHSREPVRSDTLIFSGYKWVIKESKGKRTGPGNNYFTGKNANVWVDKEGKLHLRLTYRDGKWYCPEIQSVNTFGYGRYHFHLEPFRHELAKEIVVGLFTYDHDDSIRHHKETDIEIALWGKPNNLNTQYVIQPFESEAHRFDTDLKRNTRHMIDIRRKKICFRSEYESGLYTERKKRTISSTTKKPPYPFEPGQEHVNINVWLYNSTAPENGKEFELVLSQFRFEQLWIHKLLRFIHKKKK